MSQKKIGGEREPQRASDGQGSIPCAIRPPIIPARISPVPPTAILGCPPWAKALLPSGPVNVSVGPVTTIAWSSPLHLESASSGLFPSSHLSASPMWGVTTPVSRRGHCPDGRPSIASASITTFVPLEEAISMRPWTALTDWSSLPTAGPMTTESGALPAVSYTHLPLPTNRQV